MIRPHVRDILMTVLKLTADTQVDELPAIVDTILENFEEDVIPVAYDVALELVGFVFSNRARRECNYFYFATILLNRFFKI